MGMFDALLRWYRVRTASIEALIDADAEELLTDPYVVRVRYKEIIAARTKRVAKFRDGVARTAAIQIQTKRDLERVTEESTKAEKVAQGYLNQAMKRKEALEAQGKGPDEIRADVAYMQARAGFEAQKQSANAKKAEVERLTAQLARDTETVNRLETQLTTEHRKLGELEREAATAEGRAAAAKARAEAADLITGLSQDPTVQEHAALRKAVDNLEAKAEVNERLAGTDSAHRDEEALRSLEQAQAADEFDQLVGLGVSKDAPAKVTAGKAEEVKLPE